MTKASRATVSVPAAGPKRRTDVNTNVSETEMVAGREGRRMVADPLTRVRTARIVQLQSPGVRAMSVADWTIVAKPANAMQVTYNCIGSGSPRKCVAAISLRPRAGGSWFALPV